MPSMSKQSAVSYQHPGARRDTTSAGGACDPPSKRRNFLQEDKQRQERDPKHVHHAAHKQKCHQNPAAADAINSVAKPQQQAPRHIAAKAAMAHKEPERGLALGETDVLEWIPLLDAHRNQHDPSEHVS